MAHQCPRCGGPVHRGYSSNAQLAAGLVGALFYAAFGDFQCARCGKIPHSEFPAKVRSKIVLTSFVLVVCAVGLAAAVLSLIAAK